MSTDTTQLLDTLIAAAQLPYPDWPARWPTRPAVGYLCTYAPEEIAHAAGFTPIRLRTSRQPIGRADAHLPSFTCALCRSTLDQALGGELSFLAGMIFPHTCDTLQALADIWRENLPTWVETAMQPANLSAPSARPYLVAELERFRQRMAGHAGRPITDDELRASIALHNETRRLLTALHGQRAHLTTAQFYAIVEAAMVMPKEAFNPLAAQLVERLPAAPEPQGDGPRLLLVGPVVDDPTVLELIDVLGAQVVGDDLCTGRRYFDGRVATDGQPIAALADYFLQRLPCPTKHNPHFRRDEHLLSLARDTGAEGIVFILQKFCDPHAFEYAIIKPQLEAAGVPHLQLDMEHIPAVGQLRTRLEAFIEMLA